MLLIETGDLSLSDEKGTQQARLFHAIRDKIVRQLWPLGGQLPSTRKLAQELSLSRNTITAAYEQLVAEGYIQSRRASGFYVSLELPERYFPVTHPPQAEAALPTKQMNTPFTPGVPDLKLFPHAKWQRLLQRHMSRNALLGSQDLQGCPALRTALSDYLASSRSVRCNPQRIIITSGAQQALFIALMATLNKTDKILMEQPGYPQVHKIISMLGIGSGLIPVNAQTGLDIERVLVSHANALYVTPSNQYPMGTTLNTDQRLKLIEWAVAGDRWIIEDDYDSEFQFAHRPYTSLQGLSEQVGGDEHVIYIGSFSKVMFNSLRLGYLVVPESLISRCLTIKDASSGSSPAHTQAALADFILEGDLLRHIRKMRRLYKEKYLEMVAAIERHFGSQVEIISQAAGLHITLRWQQRVDEQLMTQQAKEQGITIRPVSHYENNQETQRRWRGVVLGFGNIDLKNIDPQIATLAQLFESQLPHVSVN